MDPASVDIMFSQIRLRRFRAYGMTTLSMSGPDSELEIKLVSRMDKRERRAFVRSFFVHIRPWVRYFTQVTIDHSNDGLMRNRRAIERGVHFADEAPVTSLLGSLGYKIRTRRLELGLSQRQLARRIGIQRSHLSEIERGLHMPNSRTRLELERVLGQDVG